MRRYVTGCDVTSLVRPRVTSGDLPYLDLSSLDRARPHVTGCVPAAAGGAGAGVGRTGGSWRADSSGVGPQRRRLGDEDRRRDELPEW